MISSSSSSSSKSSSLRGKKAVDEIVMVNKKADDQEPLRFFIDDSHRPPQQLRQQRRSLIQTPPSFSASYDKATSAPTTTTTSSSSSSSSSEPPANGHLGLIIFVVATIISISLVVWMIVKEFYYRRYGVDLCYGKCNCFPFLSKRTARSQANNNDDEGQDGGNNNNSNDGSSSSSSSRQLTGQEQYDADRAMAVELQRQLNEQDRETDRLNKRAERKKWYNYYLKKRCMTVEDEDLFYGQETTDSTELKLNQKRLSSNCETDNDNNNEENIEGYGLQSPTAANGRRRAMSLGDSSEDGFTTDDDFDFDDDDEGGNGNKFNDKNSTRTDQLPSLCNKDDDGSHLYLQMPYHQEVSPPPCSYVDGECALCLDTYDAGDEVVWSDLQCRHAFHKECIMQWLSKGKKRCPICRNWFVPGARIEDQKKEHGELWQAAMEEMEKQNTEDEVSDDTGTPDDQAPNATTDDLPAPVPVTLPCTTNDDNRPVEGEATADCPRITASHSEGSGREDEDDIDNMPHPQRKETDRTEQTTPMDEFDSTSNSQSYDIETGSSSFGDSIKSSVLTEEHSVV